MKNLLAMLAWMLALTIAIAACAAPPAAPEMIPPTGGQPEGPVFTVREYALVEQSLDVPTHAGFEAWAPAAVDSARAGWLFNGPEQALTEPNQRLAQFGYRLALNPSPPFSAFALYAGDSLVQRDIARFWPVTVNQSGPAGQGDFRLAYETLAGERLSASQAGIGADDTRAGAGDADEARSYSGPALESRLVSLVGAGLAPAPQAPSSGEVFGARTLAGQPFFFYARDDIVRLNHAGRDLPYTYDLVLHGKTGELTIFNPGSAGELVWFYALRDGLWYYVEVGR